MKMVVPLCCCVVRGKRKNLRKKRLGRGEGRI